MGLTPSEVDELLGAWALDLLDDRTRADVESVLAEEPALARRAYTLRDAAGWLGAPLATSPPADLRASVLDRAARRRPAGAVVGGPEEPASPPAVYRAQVERLHRLLLDLPSQAWAEPAIPYPWTVHGLVGHLVAVERYFEGLVDGRSDHPADEADHLAMTEPTVAAELLRSPAETVAAWHDTATAVLDALARDGDAVPAGDAELSLHGIPMTLDGALVVRAFELWTHADDIRRAAGLAPVDPPPEEVRTMADRSVRALPFLSYLASPLPAGATARIVLTGRGGGTWDLTAVEERAAGGPVVTIVADAVGYCRLASRRLEPDELAPAVRGDAELAGQLFEAARSLAV